MLQKSLEQELKETELSPARIHDLTTGYKEIIKALHEIGPELVRLENTPSKANSIYVLKFLADIRLVLFPALENSIKGLRKDINDKLKQKRAVRSPEEVEKLRQILLTNKQKNKKP